MRPNDGAAHFTAHPTAPAFYTPGYGACCLHSSDGASRMPTTSTSSSRPRFQPLRQLRHLRTRLQPRQAQAPRRPPPRLLQERRAPGPSQVRRRLLPRIHRLPRGQRPRLPGTDRSKHHHHLVYLPFPPPSAAGPVRRPSLHSPARFMDVRARSEARLCRCPWNEDDLAKSPLFFGSIDRWSCQTLSHPDDVWLKIALTSGSKPKSSILSASSRTYAKKSKNIYHTI